MEFTGRLHRAQGAGSFLREFFLDHAEALQAAGVVGVGRLPTSLRVNVEAHVSGVATSAVFRRARQGSRVRSPSIASRGAEYWSGRCRRRTSTRCARSTRQWLRGDTSGSAGGFCDCPRDRRSWSSTMSGSDGVKTYHGIEGVEAATATSFIFSLGRCSARRPRSSSRKAMTLWLLCPHVRTAEIGSNQEIEDTSGHVWTFSATPG